MNGIINVKKEKGFAINCNCVYTVICMADYAIAKE